MAKKTISKKTDRGSQQFLLRLPGTMRKQLAEVAEREGHTMNAVIVNALALYFNNEDMMPWSKGYRLSADIETAIKNLVGQLDNQHQELVQLITQGNEGASPGSKVAAQLAAVAEAIGPQPSTETDIAINDLLDRLRKLRAEGKIK